MFRLTHGAIGNRLRILFTDCLHPPTLTTILSECIIFFTATKQKGGAKMDKAEIALHLTSKAMELGLIRVKPENFFEGENSFEEANKFAAKQVNDFYHETLQRLIKYN